MELIHEENRIYANDPQGRLVAEITFPVVDENIVDINHTYVSPSLRGQGVAEQLIKAVIADLEARGQKARTTCSYADSWFYNHKEYHHLQD
jgi:predicted GNAT family acetyltransferase